ncbi:GIY-YIG nuclease family protein [Rhodohalobacter sp. 8-1]|uniref:GIY-YIG nuclease family protein n=1 Tax=Rhodohalobacter sp. 8-1 TaxID=3131972 RepID=UPI00403EFFBD
MHHVYVLYSPLYDKIYIGESSNLGDRFISHNLETNKGWTGRYRPWVLVFEYLDHYNIQIFSSIPESNYSRQYYTLPGLVLCLFARWQRAL